MLQRFRFAHNLGRGCKPLPNSLSPLKWTDITLFTLVQGCTKSFFQCWWQLSLLPLANRAFPYPTIIRARCIVPLRDSWQLKQIEYSVL